ncbi:MAG: hypothetical protein J6W28_06540, partial [Clostridia bacterium]|nr:hypothetical protein [Clostridia bacterium]
HLIGLYTAFSANDDSVLFGYGMWKNKVVGGVAATLYDDTAHVDWTLSENGGLTLGIDSYDDWKNVGLKGAGIRLNESWADLASFTVETSSLAKGAYMPSKKSETDLTGGQTLYTADGPNFEETFCLDMISSATYFNLYSNNGLGMGFISRMEGVSGKAWYSMEGRSEAYRALLKATNEGATDRDFGSIPAGLTLAYTKATDAANVTFGMSFSTGAKANIDGGEKNAEDKTVSSVGSYAYTLEKYQEVKAAATITNGHKFSLYNRGMYDVYAIRVYDKVLNAEEMAQNHFVDLLAFYGIAVPDGLTAATFAPFAPAAAELADLPFYTDEAKATEAKAAIEASIAAVAKVVLLDDATDAPIVTVYAVNGEVALPAIIDGRTVIAYADMDMRYAFPGEKIAVEGTAYYYAIGTAEPIISTDEKVDMKLYEETVGEGEEATTEQKLGIRFNATVNFAALQEKLDLMNEFIDDESLKIAIKNYGILVAPKAYVDAAGAFTEEALDAYAAANGSTAGAYVAISSEEWYDDTDAAAYKLVGGLVDFSAASIENNVEFAAIAFIELDVDEDPYSDTIVYGAYNADACITLKAAAENALAGMEVTAPEYAALNELLARFSGESEE